MRTIDIEQLFVGLFVVILSILVLPITGDLSSASSVIRLGWDVAPLIGLIIVYFHVTVYSGDQKEDDDEWS
ncbi:MAG: hypothetical protein ACTSW1_07345 [Candidatus Hodarchaeales archaeon]